MVEEVTEQTNSKQNRPGQLGNTIGNRWQPGESGNPGGRPKYKPISDKLRVLLDSPYTEDGRTYADHIAKTIVDDLLDPAGNLKHGFNNALLKELLERVEGNVKGEIEVTEIQKIEYVPAKEKEDAA